ncbi:MAG: DUF285 domain-containing protein [Clostridiales bacterium]|nr:DUF285 domain-containing protein [Clostridiales bacterium]
MFKNQKKTTSYNNATRPTASEQPHTGKKGKHRRSKWAVLLRGALVVIAVVAVAVLALAFWLGGRSSVLGDVGNANSERSLDGVTAKEDITTVYFVSSLAEAPENAADLSKEGDGSVLCWTKGTTQYIAGRNGVTGGVSCEELFAGYENLTSIQFNDCFDTANVTDMSEMFYNCYALESLDLSGWDTANVTDMGGLFYNCTLLESLDLSGWDTANVTDMSYLFFNCSALTSLNLSKWNTSSVTTMQWMFGFCTALESLNLSGWDTSSVTDMGCMFWFCFALTDFDTGWLDTSNADTTLMYMGTSVK